ncbi:MAG: GTPase domain-containing protein, partial [Geothrix sp.]|nr:GTPase domain-containing protein [Geothrix sp.]
DATRKLVLRGADAVVFVADSQAPALESNKESFQNLIANLRDQGSELEKIPHVIQWNKRDTPNALPVETLDREINLYQAPTFEACAMRGEGVRETLTGVAKLVLKSLADRYGGGVVEEPAVFQGEPPPPEPSESTKPMEVEELSAGELLEEIDEMPGESGPAAHAPPPSHMPHASVVEVPVVLDRSLFSGESPVEIRLKLYIK